MSAMAERELEATISATPPKYHPLTVSRIDSISTLVFDHKIKRKHRDAKKMLMYGKEASNRKQEIDRQHYTIPNQRPKDKHCGKI